MLSAPGLSGSKLHLSLTDKYHIWQGDLGPVSKEFLKTVSALEYGRIALLGYSQGADLATAGARKAFASNLDTQSLSIGEPVSVTKRYLPTLAHDFFLAAPDIEKVATETGLKALDRARGIREDYRLFLASAPYPMNLLIARGMSQASFETQMNQTIDEGIIDKIVVAYGAKSRITPPSKIEPSLARLHDQVRNEKLISIKVKDGSHAWGEQLTLLAKLYLRALG